MSNEFHQNDLGYDPEKPSRVFHPKWYVDQMSGWSRNSYILLAVGIMVQIFVGLQHGVNGLAITSTIAGIIGFSCTVSITNGKPINGVTGFISALLLSYVALVTGNYSDIVMQVAYIILLDLPVLLSRNWGNFKAKSLTKHNWFYVALLFLVFLLATYYLDTQLLNSPQAKLDALAASLGLTGAVLTTVRFKESYYFWLAQGLTSVFLWTQTALNGHPVWVLLLTYCLYLCNDFLAMFDKGTPWFSKAKHNDQHHVA